MKVCFETASVRVRSKNLASSCIRIRFCPRPQLPLFLTSLLACDPFSELQFLFYGKCLLLKSHWNCRSAVKLVINVLARQPCHVQRSYLSLNLSQCRLRINWLFMCIYTAAKSETAICHITCSPPCEPTAVALTAWVANKSTAVWPAKLTNDWRNISACYSVIEI